MARGSPFFYGMLLPVAIVLAINFMIYVVVILKITYGRNKAQAHLARFETREQRSARLRAQTKDRLRNAIAIGTLVGVTWLFGFMSFGPGHRIFKVLFTIFNSTQGVFIFILFGIRQPEVAERLGRACQGLLISKTQKDNDSSFSFEYHKGVPSSVPLKCSSPSPNVTLISYTPRNSGAYSETVVEVL